MATGYFNSLSDEKVISKQFFTDLATQKISKTIHDIESTKSSETVVVFCDLEQYPDVVNFTCSVDDPLFKIPLITESSQTCFF